ncbi:MAG: DsbA family protein [Capsulimonadaceae bacterium]
MRSLVSICPARVLAPILRTLATAAAVCLLVAAGGSLSAARADDSTAPADIETLKSQLANLVFQEKQLLDDVGLARQMVLNPGGEIPQSPSDIHVPVDVPVAFLPIEGSLSARVAVIEYTDFQSKSSGEYERNTYPQIQQNYIQTGKIRYFYSDFPIDGHTSATYAAQAAACSNEQGRFWNMHYSLFANQDALGDEACADRAEAFQMDMARYRDCMQSGRYLDQIRRNVASAKALGISTAPVLLIGRLNAISTSIHVDYVITGSQDYSAYKADIDAELAAP